MRTESFNSGVQLDGKGKLWQEAYLTVLWVPSVSDGLSHSPPGLCLQGKRRMLNSSPLSSCFLSVVWLRLKASSSRGLGCQSKCYPAHLMGQKGYYFVALRNPGRRMH